MMNRSGASLSSTISNRRGPFVKLRTGAESAEDSRVTGLCQAEALPHLFGRARWTV